MKIVPGARSLPDARALGQQIGAGRAVIAAAILAAPVPAARLLGADTATAQRVTWLSRMMAIRDGALGAGAVDALRRGRDPVSWLLGGAVADAVDAVVIAGALKRGRLRGVVPMSIVVGAAGTSALGVVTALRIRGADRRLRRQA
ncbi:MAG: hypothetical protein QOH52_1131 [Pseudonocardiales bacterium]|nr:hypothetical protein [Pseudonocardiales bacterium]